MFQFFETLFDLISSVIGFFVNTNASVGRLFINAFEGVVFVSFIFGYKVLSNRKVGFPEKAFDKVIETIENISYIISNSIF